MSNSKRCSKCKCYRTFYAGTGPRCAIPEMEQVRIANGGVPPYSIVMRANKTSCGPEAKMWVANE